MRPLSPPTSTLSYYLRITLGSPFILLAMLLQTAWSMTTGALCCWRLVYQQELKPMYASYVELWTPKACRRARSLARGSSPWSKYG